MSMSRWARLILAGVGLGLFGFLVWRVGVGRLLGQMERLGWGLAAIVGVGGVSHGVKTWAWGLTFEEEHRGLGWGPLLAVRLAGEAVSQLSFAGQVFGETTRALMLRSAVPLVNGISSVVLDRGMYSLTGLLLMVMGLGWWLLTRGGRERLWVSGGLVVLGLVGLALLLGLALGRRWPVLTLVWSGLGRLGRLRAGVERQRARVEEIERNIQSFYHRRRGAFWASGGLNLVGHGLGVVEVYLALWLLGVKVTLVTAFFIVVLTKLVNMAGAVIPGNVGVYEGGNMMILETLGLGGANGLTLGIVRRIRRLVWTGVGLVVLLLWGVGGGSAAARAGIGPAAAKGGGD